MPRPRKTKDQTVRQALVSLTILDGIGADAKPVPLQPDLLPYAGKDLYEWPATLRDPCWLSSLTTLRSNGEVKAVHTVLYEDVFELGDLEGNQLKRTPSCHPDCVNPAHRARVPGGRLRKQRRRPALLPPVRLENFDIRWDDGKEVTVGQILRYLDRPPIEWPDRCIFVNGTPDTVRKTSVRRTLFKITTGAVLRRGSWLRSVCRHHACVNPRHMEQTFGQRRLIEKLHNELAEATSGETPLTVLIEQARKPEHFGPDTPREMLDQMAEANGMTLRDFLEVEILKTRKPAPKAATPTISKRTTDEWLDDLEEVPVAQVSPRRLILFVAREWPDHPFTDPDNLSFTDMLPLIGDMLPNLREALGKSQLWRAAHMV